MRPRKNTVRSGQQFGFWTVLDVVPFSTNTPKALCQCICGTKKEVRIHYLMTGKSKSCGCARGAANLQEYKECKFRSHPHIVTRSRPQTRRYKIWLNLKRQQENKIKRVPLCAEWQTWENFRAWAESAGYREGYHTTLVRYNVNGGYHPKNCYWL